jgi:polysaccharide export outer membrane protein
MNIFQAIALVGQMQDELIDYKKVKIIRLNENGQSVEKTFDLTSTSIIESEYYYIKPNDYIYFSTSPDRSFFRIASATQFITTITSTFTMVMGYVLMAQTLKSTN